MLANNILDKYLTLQCGNKFSSTLLMGMNEESKKGMVTQINKLLSKSSSRIDGIQMLNECLCQFSPQMICEHGPGWITYCLNHHEKDHNNEVYLRTLSSIIEYSQNYPDFNKKFVSDFLAPTLDMALKISGDINVKEASLKYLASCLNNYASSCNSFKARIEDYTLCCLDTSSDKLNLAAGSVFFHCQQIGNAGCDGNNFVNSITLSIRRLCVTCHKIFDSILEDQIEYENYESNDIEPLNIKSAPIHYSDQLKLHHKVQCLKNSLNWIIILLRKRSTKVIYAQEILSVIQRGISSHNCLEQNLSSFESAHFAFHFITIHIEVLKLLGIFIRLMGVTLFPFYHTISKIILDAIMRSHSCSCYFRNNLLQEYLYDVFTVWLKLGGTELDQSMQDKLVTFFTKEVFLDAGRVSLKLDTNLTKKSLKMNNFQQNKTAKKASESSVHSVRYDLMVYSSALNTLRILFKHTQLSLSDSILHNLYSFILKSILNVQNGETTFPFNEEICQLMLYKILCTIFEQNSLKLLPPLQVIINILRKGCKHESEIIRGACLKGLNKLEKICQPACKSLYSLDNQKFWNKLQSLDTYAVNSFINVDNSLQTYEVNPVINVDNSLDVSIAISNEVLTAKRSSDVNVIFNKVPTAMKNSDVRVLSNEVIVAPTQESEVVDTRGGQIDKVKENRMNGVEKKHHGGLKMAITPSENKGKFSTKNVEKLGNTVSKKRKLEQEVDNSIKDYFVDVVNCDYE